MIQQHATIGDTVYFWFAANDTSGSGGDGATPLFDVREAGAAASAIPLLSGTPTLLTHADYPAGCHEVAVVATVGNGFAADDTFAVFCTLAIDSQNPSGFIGSCTLTPLAKSSAQTTAQNDLDTITGSDGVTLATAQGLYAPSKVGDAMTLTASATSAQLVDDIYDEAESDHNASGSFGKGFRQVKEGTISAESTINDASATTTSFVTALTEATDDHYSDVSLVFIDGTLVGQSRPILNYNGTTNVITLEEALTEAPANGDGFIIKTDHVHPISQIQAGLATETKQDIIDTNVDSVLTNIAALNNLADSEVLTQVNAALDTAISELGVATPTATPTLRTGLMLLYMMARNRVDVDTTGTDAMKIYNNAGTQITSKAITDDGTDYSEAEMS